jgi:cell division topological specificity factor MinE
MMNFFFKSRSRAKKRLVTCINDDRRSVSVSTLEKIRAEIEDVINKYAELDGCAEIEISKENQNMAYITLGARLKGYRL